MYPFKLLSPDTCPAGRLLGHVVTLFLVFKEPPCCSSQWPYQFTFPPTLWEVPLLFMPSPGFTVCRFSDDGHSNWCEVMSDCSFDLHFSIHEWRWTSFRVSRQRSFSPNWFQWSGPSGTWWCCYSVCKSCLTLCDPMDFDMPGFPVLHHLLQFAQTHVHWVGDAIQPSHLLLLPSPPALSLSQHQGLFQWVSSLHEVAKILAHQHQSFQWMFRVDFFWDWQVWFPCSPRDSQESPGTTVQKYQFFGTQPSLWSNSHTHTWLLEKP